MIDFYSEITFAIDNRQEMQTWLAQVISSEGKQIGELVYVFCDDAYLHKLNVQFLNHDTLTDIITFDNTLGDEVAGEIYISIERVRENATTYAVSFDNELHRVIVHGVLHLCGYKDKTEEEQRVMRQKEEEALQKLNYRK